MTLIATASRKTIDANGNVIDLVQTVGSIDRIRKESGWTHGDGDRSDLEVMDKPGERMVIEHFGKFARNTKKDKQVRKNTKKGYKAVSGVVQAVTDVHCTFRDAQVRVAEELVAIAQFDAIADAAIARTAQEYQAARAKSDAALAQIANIFGV